MLLGNLLSEGTVTDRRERTRTEQRSLLDQRTRRADETGKEGNEREMLVFLMVGV